MCNIMYVTLRETILLHVEGHKWTSICVMIWCKIKIKITHPEMWLLHSFVFVFLNQPRIHRPFVQFSLITNLRNTFLTHWSQNGKQEANLTQLNVGTISQLKTQGSPSFKCKMCDINVLFLAHNYHLHIVQQLISVPSSTSIKSGKSWPISQEAKRIQVLLLL